MIIYQAINNVNSKSYIGMTKYSIDVRKVGHEATAINNKGQLFYEIIKKTQIPVINYYSHIDKPEDIVEQLCRMGCVIG